jgi:hypothetical protein
MASESYAFRKTARFRTSAVRDGGGSEASPLGRGGRSESSAFRRDGVSEGSPLAHGRLHARSGTPHRPRWSSTTGNVSSESSSEATDDTTRSEADEDSDYEVLQGFRMGTSFVKESESDISDEARSNGGNVSVRELQSSTGKEVFSIISSQYYDDTLSANGQVWVNNGDQLGAELVHTMTVNNRTVQHEPLFRWM